MVAQSTRKVDGGRIPGAAACPQCVEVKMFFLLPNAKTATCTLHGRNLGTFNPSIPTANSLHVALSGSMVTHLAPWTATGLVMEAVEVRDMTDPTHPVFRSNSTGVSIGSASGPMPADVQAVLTENLVIRGRGQKGRVYLPGWSTLADSSTGTIASQVVTAINQLGTDWMANLQAASLTPCVAKVARQEYLGVTGALHPARAAFTVDVSSYTCHDNEWDTQRRRGQ